MHGISGSLKITKLQAMENHKMIEFEVFRQPQQLDAISKIRKRLGVDVPALPSSPSDGYDDNPKVPVCPY
jgi:hypothetical protein